MGAAEKLEDNRLNVNIRRLQKMGSSLYVAIPKKFAAKMNLAAGEEVVVVSKGESVRVLPVKES